MKPRSQLRDITAPRVHVVKLATVPRHDRPSQKRWHFNCLCVPVTCDESCFSFRCAQRIREKLVQLRRGGPQSQCKSRATFHVSTSSQSRPETSSPGFNSTCLCLVGGSGTHRKHPEASQQPEMVEFLQRLQHGLLKHGMPELKLFFCFQNFTSSYP